MRHDLERRQLVAAAALLIDYVVTAAVQPAAGTVALCSAIPALHPYHLEITIGVLLLICMANLRGLRQSGRVFAVTTYAFVAMITLTILALASDQIEAWRSQHQARVRERRQPAEKPGDRRGKWRTRASCPLRLRSLYLWRGNFIPFGTN